MTFNKKEKEKEKKKLLQQRWSNHTRDWQATRETNDQQKLHHSPRTSQKTSRRRRTSRTHTLQQILASLPQTCKDHKKPVGDHTTPRT